MGLLQPAVDPQLLQLVFQIQAVAALGLDGGDAQVEHLVQEGHGFLKERILTGRAGLTHRVQNAAAGPQDIEIPGAAQFEGDLSLPVAAENHVGMAVDEAGRDQASAGVDDLVGLFGARGQLAVGRDGADDAALDEEGGIFQLDVLTLLFPAVPEGADRGLQRADVFDQQHIIHPL